MVERLVCSQVAGITDRQAQKSITQGWMHSGGGGVSRVQAGKGLSATGLTHSRDNRVLAGRGTQYTVLGTQQGC